MLVLRRDIFHGHSTAGARNACCDTFSEIAKYPSQVRAGVIAFVLKSEHKYQYCITVPYLLDCLTTIVDQCRLCRVARDVKFDFHFLTDSTV